MACVLGTYCPDGSEIYTSCPLGWFGSVNSNNTYWARDDACAEVRLLRFDFECGDARAIFVDG